VCEQCIGPRLAPAFASGGDPALVPALSDLVRRGNGEFTVRGILRQLCLVAARGLGVDGAGVMQVQDGRLRFIHADPRRLIGVERLQETLQRGPCRDSIDRQQAVIVDDVATADQWPELVQRAARAGLGSILSMPLLARERSWGVLDVYRSAARPWSRQDLLATRLFADVAASFVAMAADHDLARITRHELEHRATHDHLTGLPNRALLFDRLEHALDSAARYQRGVAVLFVDVDRFKNINDTLGHAIGDVTLVEVARRLRGTLRDSDTLARLSGDEFVVICENLDGPADEIHRWLEVLGRRIQRELQWDTGAADVSLLVTVSIGAAATLERVSAKDLLADADEAMYRAKQRGGAQFLIHERGFGSSPGQFSNP
jgi:diguanylate cyclase (GGDEF)-like protein